MERRNLSHCCENIHGWVITYMYLEQVERELRVGFPWSLEFVTCDEGHLKHDVHTRVSSIPIIPQ